MRISDWSSDVCSSDLGGDRTTIQARKTPSFRLPVTDLGYVGQPHITALNRNGEVADGVHAFAGTKNTNILLDHANTGETARTVAAECREPCINLRCRHAERRHADRSKDDVAFTVGNIGR